ncbi:hypothetical protein FAJ35_02400 [Streptococcus suis]|uniref:Uncharacterized protein n=1 Tax=Streptococcus suis TaxID=1307 RepID=A0A4T2GV07_STRSU|nr:hypothetical protein FAJ35_02400 [Streptococcus suis]
MIRSDLECKTRTNLPINHCAEMLTLTLRSGAGLEPSLSVIISKLVMLHLIHLHHYHVLPRQFVYFP